MIARSCPGPRLQAELARATSRNGWLPMCRTALDPGRASRLSCAWNSPQRRRSALKAKPAVACTLPLAATFSDRANASRRELVMGGMTETKVLRVVGLADSMHLDNADPRNPINRRISIILLNRQTQERIERENSGAGATPSARVGAPLPATASGSNVKSTSFKPSTPTQ